MAERLFELLSEPDEAVYARLRERLVSESERDGVLDLGYRTLDTPVGSLLLAATDRGLVRVAFAQEDHDAVLESLAERISPRVLHAPRRLDAVSTQLAEYFAGVRTVFEIPLDFSLARGFRREVLTKLTEIGYGNTASYTQIATEAGNPRAVRAAGTACAKNPLPVLVPCHRVLRSDGSVGGYVGGPEAKRALLRLESSTESRPE